ncbi:class II fructose-1,6-bisphosphate aldolase [Candidatus Woesearchaeota archaeon]|nr:class II fructose-1,6-bisphosphate aldolase [Candidatus Woesearchaeota archaeon]
MTLVTMKKILAKANKEGYAVGAFNINNMEILQGVIKAGENLKSPLIISCSEGAIEYAGIDYLINLVTTAAKLTKIPIALHLDHGKNFKIIKQCIDKGFTSIMIDASHYDFKENVKLTKRAVALARKKGVTVEAEIGKLSGVEDLVSERRGIYTDPAEAFEFVKQTKVDALAIAIGTSHGAYKFKGESHLEFSILKEIKSKLKMPLVLHGASSVYPELVEKVNSHGGEMENAHGVTDSLLKKACKLGINKVNTDTDLRLAFTGALRESLMRNKTSFDPRKYLIMARDDITKVVERKIKVFGSQNKA